MGQASGVYKVVAYKSANTAGIAAAGSGAKALRRVTSDVDINKDSYSSNEIRTDLQDADFRHGVRRGGPRSLESCRPAPTPTSWPGA